MGHANPTPLRCAACDDDETPMAFVVTVLERFFGMSIWRPLRTWAVPKHATAINSRNRRGFRELLERRANTRYC
jgi:hypothetical protein